MNEEILQLVTIEPTVVLVDQEQPTVELSTINPEASTLGAALEFLGTGYPYDRLVTGVFTANQIIQPSISRFLTISAYTIFDERTVPIGPDFLDITRWVKELKNKATWDAFIFLQVSADPSGDRFASMVIDTYVPDGNNPYDTFLERKVLTSKTVRASQLGITTVDFFRISFTVVLDLELTTIVRVYAFQNSPVPLTIMSGEFTIAARLGALR